MGGLRAMFVASLMVSLLFVRSSVLAVDPKGSQATGKIDKQHRVEERQQQREQFKAGEKALHERFEAEKQALLKRFEEERKALHERFKAEEKALHERFATEKQRLHSRFEEKKRALHARSK